MIFKIILNLVLSTVCLFWLASCSSVPAQEKNAKMMNIWVSPEYASASRLVDQNYIAVFITSTTPVLGENGTEASNEVSSES